MIEKNQLITIGAILILVLGVVGLVYMRPTPATNEVEKKVVAEEPEQIEVIEESAETPAETGTTTENTTPTTKEFAVESFYDDSGMWFSLKEINVKKGDNVKVMVKNIKGVHDFSLDEYGIKKDLPLDEEVIIEFVADKAGEFVYYCSMPGHREKGQWGTLRVTE